MKKLFSILIFISTVATAFAQQNGLVDAAAARSIMQNCAQVFPKFYREFQYTRTHDPLIKRFVFIRNDEQGPAFANPNGTIRINVKFLENQIPGFDDNRLIVVLYHEIGHLHYYLNTPLPDRTSANSEQAAFEYSLLKTKELAEQGDCLPLKTGLKFMKARSLGNNLADPHVRALKIMVTEPLYFDYLNYVNTKCGE